MYYYLQVILKFDFFQVNCQNKPNFQYIQKKTALQMESVENTYKKVTQIEHILLRPDTYIGSTTVHDQAMWVLQEDQLMYEKISYVPGLYKIFDEILVNAADNYQRDNKMTKIQVNIQNNGTITVTNDGKSIPIQIHKEHKIYVAQMIFGHLLTSSNYEDHKKKVTGGRNGYGAKLANIFSKYFYVQTADSSHRKIMKIEWKNNMGQMIEPIIQPYEGKDYTKVSFIPDFQRFGMKKLSKQMISLMKKRVYDMAGILKVKVYLNGKLVPIKTFKDYVSLYVKDQHDLIFDDTIISKRWSVMITKSDGQFQQVSFVNGICTTKGGTHVNHIADQIVEKLLPKLKAKAKDIAIKPFQVKNHMRIFVNCLIQNPSFDSQTKQTLTTPLSKFGSTFQITEKMIKEIQKSGICQKILNSLRHKENSKIDKQLKKLKANKFIIPKLQEANLAGKSNKCTLILTEGDSAKALAMSGIQQLGRDLYGVFPLRGKVVNSRQITQKQVMDNFQLSSIIKILGLSFNKQYNSTDSLRYSSVMIMADQDIDGSHIKGLIINFFQTFWPSLCKINGFLKQFVTPIIRCKNNAETVDFFSIGDYQVWKVQAGLEWKIKYYKGLGTSTCKQAKEYFSNLQKHQIKFKYSDQNDKEAMELAFSKKNADARKRWLQNYDHRINVDYDVKTLKIEDFIHKEFIHFSISDNVRSIPSIIDGLKPSQRKILFACFKRNLRSQIKVAQLTGYVAQHSAYHHGQQSLSSTIVSMAQNYVGSNNLNLLQPIGQFGTRHLNGKDHASPRYIFTNLNPLTRYLFNEADDHIVDYIQEENMMIQPQCYYPILPLVLINGAEGIGTGWSTTILPHKVDDVIEAMRKRLKGNVSLLPVGWQGYKGQIIFDKTNVYIVRGEYQIDGDTVSITQIPPNKSIRDYKTFLQQKVDSIQNKDPDLEDIRQYHEGSDVHFDITFIQGKQPVDDQMQKFLKLSSNYQQNNMVLFNAEKKIKKYERVQQIIQEFYEERLKAYTKRKQYLVSRFKRQFQILSAKISFIKQVITGNFKMMDKKEEWIRQLIRNKYKAFNQLTKTKSTKKQEYQQNQESNKDYNYLLSLPIWSFCQEKVNELSSTRNQIQTIIQYYEKVKQIQLWQKDLNQFQQAWESYKNSKYAAQSVKRKQNGGGMKKQIKRRRQKSVSEDQQSDQQQQKQKNSSVKQSKMKRNTKKVNIMQEELGLNSKRGSKKVKPSQTIQESKMQLQLQIKKKPQKKQDENNIDSILSKYLVTASSDGMTFQQRLKARLAKEEKQNVFSQQIQLELESQKEQEKQMSMKKKQDQKKQQPKKSEQNNKKSNNEGLQKYDWLMQ